MSPTASSAVSPDVAQTTLLSVQKLTLGFGARAALADVSFDLASTGVACLMGPAGGGKSSILRTLGRYNEQLPSFFMRGQVQLHGKNLHTEFDRDAAQKLVPLLSQKARLYTASVLDNAISAVRGEAPLSYEQKRELAHQVLAPWTLWPVFSQSLDEPVLSTPIAHQRMLAVARLLSAGASCLLADEPLRDLPEDGAAALFSLLRRVAERYPVLLVTHNLRVARSLSDRILLLVAGSLVEDAPTEQFFTAPKTDLARQFGKTGNCWPARSPEEWADEDVEAVAESEAAQSREDPEASATSQWRPMPGGFHWILKDQLGGMQRPGLLTKVEDDILGLKTLGCRVLVNLMEDAMDIPAMEAAGIEYYHFPIVDMKTPSLPDAALWCQRIAGWLEEGRTTVLHCKAGLGRTGTILACVLVWLGDNPVQAVHRVRSTNQLYIQSEEQLQFLNDFGHFCRPEATS